MLSIMLMRLFSVRRALYANLGSKLFVPVKMMLITFSSLSTSMETIGLSLYLTFTKIVEYYDSHLVFRHSAIAATALVTLTDWIRHFTSDPDWNSNIMNNAPEQANDFDCGVFTCSMAYSLACKLHPSTFVQRDIEQFRRWITLSLLNRFIPYSNVWFCTSVLYCWIDECSVNINITVHWLTLLA